MIVCSISVLICTYNRSGLLRETLAALQEMEAPDMCSVEIWQRLGHTQVDQVGAPFARKVAQ